MAQAYNGFLRTAYKDEHFMSLVDSYILGSRTNIHAAFRVYWATTQGFYWDRHAKIDSNFLLTWILGGSAIWLRSRRQYRLEGVVFFPPLPLSEEALSQQADGPVLETAFFDSPWYKEFLRQEEIRKHLRTQKARTLNEKYGLGAESPFELALINPDFGIYEQRTMLSPNPDGSFNEEYLIQTREPEECDLSLGTFLSNSECQAMLRRGYWTLEEAVWITSGLPLMVMKELKTLGQDRLLLLSAYLYDPEKDEYVPEYSHIKISGEDLHIESRRAIEAQALKSAWSQTENTYLVRPIEFLQWYHQPQFGRHLPPPLKAACDSFGYFGADSDMATVQGKPDTGQAHFAQTEVADSSEAAQADVPVTVSDQGTQKHEPTALLEGAPPLAGDTKASGGFLGGAHIMRQFGIDANKKATLYRRLAEYRKKNPFDECRAWIKPESPAPRSPHYLYEVSAIMGIINDLKK